VGVDRDPENVVWAVKRAATAGRSNMMNGNVAVLPKERRPTSRKCPQSTEPAVDEVRNEDWAMGVIVEVDANVAEAATKAMRDVYPGDPTEHRLRGKHNGRSRSAS
jgi:hypothetical protein